MHISPSVLLEWFVSHGESGTVPRRPKGVAAGSKGSVLKGRPERSVRRLGPRARLRRKAGDRRHPTGFVTVTKFSWWRRSAPFMVGAAAPASSDRTVPALKRRVMRRVMGNPGVTG